MDIYEHIMEVVKSAGAKPCIVELGACDGSDTVKMNDILLATGKPFSHTAVEPCANNFAGLVRRMRGRTLDVVNAAVGSVDGFVPFWYSTNKEYYGSSSIRPPKEAVKVWPTMTFEKRMTNSLTLDKICACFEKIDFIWADIQGAEVDLIEGGAGALAKTRYLYTEYCDSQLYDGEIGLAEILRRLPGWVIKEQYPGDVLLKNTAFEKTDHRDCTQEECDKLDKALTDMQMDHDKEFDDSLKKVNDQYSDSLRKLADHDVNG